MTKLATTDCLPFNHHPTMAELHNWLQALKARLYLYAASPLFQGIYFYANSSLYDPETNEPLMPLDYNPSKWNTALTACQEALTLADEQKYTQFQIANESEIPEECWPKDLIQYAFEDANYG